MVRPVAHLRVGRGVKAIGTGPREGEEGMTKAIESVVPVQDDEHKRKAALLKAVGLDRVTPEQRELALAIAKRYDLDLLLKHLVLIEGRPYITRDALLHVAHRSGVLDGIEVTEPTVRTIEGAGEFWYVEAAVYRKDMSRPFRYGGRYPTKGGNQKFAPEMATKVAECMALRRAFDVSAPTAEERWDVEMPVPQSPPAAASLPDRPQTPDEAVDADISKEARESAVALVESIFPDAVLTPEDDGKCPEHGFEWKHNSRGFYCSGKDAGRWCRRQPSLAWVTANHDAWRENNS